MNCQLGAQNLSDKRVNPLLISSVVHLLIASTVPALLHWGLGCQLIASGGPSYSREAEWPINPPLNLTFQLFKHQGGDALGQTPDSNFRHSL